MDRDAPLGELGRELVLKKRVFHFSGWRLRSAVMPITAADGCRGIFVRNINTTITFTRFAALISARQRTPKVSRIKEDDLHAAIRSNLAAGVEHRGTTVRLYKDVLDRPGEHPLEAAHGLYPMLSALEEAKRRGARVIAVNPLPEAGLLRFKNPQRPSGVLGGGTRLSDQFLQIRLGGDQALFQAFNRMLLEAGASYRMWVPVALLAGMRTDTLTAAGGVIGADWSGVAATGQR